MAVYLRGKTYWYNFRHGGKKIQGSTGKTKESDAIKFVNDAKKELDAFHTSTEGQSQKQKVAYLEKRKATITKAYVIPIETSWASYQAKMDAISPRRFDQNKSYWLDFVSFINDKYSKIKNLDEIKQEHIEAYRDQLSTIGKYDHKGSRKRQPLADRSIIEYLSLMKTIFNALSQNGQYFENPLDAIKIFKTGKKKKKANATRDVLTEKEQAKIIAFIQSDEDIPSTQYPKECNFINKAIYITGRQTGLRRGDISYLEWNHYITDDKGRSYLALETQKEGVDVKIPIKDSMLSELIEGQRGKHDFFIFPELAYMYEENDSGISDRFQKMLKHLEIGYKRTIKNADHIELIKKAISLQGKGAINKKDAAAMCNEKYTTFLGYYKKLPAPKYEYKRTKRYSIHGLRHLLAYQLYKSGVKMDIIRQILGHLTEAVSELYSRHSTEEDIDAALEQLWGE